MNKHYENENLAKKKEDAENFVNEVLKKMNPEQKRRALDIITGFSLILRMDEKSETETAKKEAELQEV